MSTPETNNSNLRLDWSPVAEISELQSYIDTYWGQGHVLSVDSQLLRWQHPQPEDPERLSVLTIKDGNSLAGMLGVIPVGFGIYGTCLPGAWLAMWLVSPERRGQRIGQRLFQRAFNDKYEFLGGLGFNDTTEHAYVIQQSQMLDSINRWVRIISAQTLESLLEGHPQIRASEISRLVQAQAKSRSRSSDTTTVRIVDWSEEAAERWDRAWIERWAKKIVGTWRDADYLRWRYVTHPVFRYVVKFAEDKVSQKLVGLLVYRVESVRDRSENILRILEFLADESGSSTLVQEILEAGESVQAAFADFYCTSTELGKRLEVGGFVQEETFPIPLPTLFQPLEFSHTPLNGAFWLKPGSAQADNSIFRSQSLYVTRSDCDQDRPN